MKRKEKLSILLILIFALVFSLPVAAKTMKIKSINHIKVTVKQGDSYALPSTVVATYSNKTKRSVSVKWNVSAVDTSAIGTYNFRGTVNGYSKKVILTLIVKENKGAMVNPLSLRENQAISFQQYYADSPKTIQLQLSEMYVGDQANSIVAQESEINQIPKSDEEWVLMKFNLKYTAGSGKLDASDIINSYSFYTPTGAKITPIDQAVFTGERDGMSSVDVQLYPGAEGVFWYGMLIKKVAGDYPLIRIGTGYDKAKYENIYTWFSTEQN